MVLPIISIIAQAPPAPLPPLFPLNPNRVTQPTPGTSQIIVRPQEVRALPGKLDYVPVLHSNSPEVIATEGILVSTYPPDGKQIARAHLNYAFNGRFDIFAHHIPRNSNNDKRPMYFGLIFTNASDKPVTVKVIQGITYRGADAPFVNLPSWVDNPVGSVFSGPGSRLANDLLRGSHQAANFPRTVTIPARGTEVVLNIPMSVGSAKSTLLRLESNGPVYAAALAMYAKPNENYRPPEPTPPVDPELPTTNSNLNKQALDIQLVTPDPAITPNPVDNNPLRPPKLEEWIELLIQRNVSLPRDRLPTHPQTKTGVMIYSRVAGIAQGSQWNATLSDPGSSELKVPYRGQEVSYVINTIPRGTLGTNQIQSAPMLARYEDTAYLSNGNYGVQYNLNIPLHNTTSQNQTVGILFQTPLKKDEKISGLDFLNPPENRVFFRGTVQITYPDDQGIPQTRYVHLVQRRGEQGVPLALINVPPGARRKVQVNFVYPPDATPPQVLTIRSMDSSDYMNLRRW